jgi:hypothetical protein
MMTSTPVLMKIPVKTSSFTYHSAKGFAPSVPLTHSLYEKMAGH